MLNKKSGFTLIELLVVIAIIGILASVALSSLNTARVSARDGTRLQEARHLQTALELYRNKNGFYPCMNGTVNPVNGCSTIVEITPASPSTNSAFRTAISWTHRVDIWSGDNSARLKYRLGSSSGNNNNPIQDTYTIIVQLEGGKVNSAGQTIAPNGRCKIDHGLGHSVYVSWFECF
jgi:prepilin-type N-terminal cleavage/methylation domain-containing protein